MIFETRTKIFKALSDAFSSNVTSLLYQFQIICLLLFSLFILVFSFLFCFSHPLSEKLCTDLGLLHKTFTREKHTGKICKLWFKHYFSTDFNIGKNSRSLVKVWCNRHLKCNKKCAACNTNSLDTYYAKKEVYVWPFVDIKPFWNWVYDNLDKERKWETKQNPKWKWNTMQDCLFILRV